MDAAKLYRWIVNVLEKDGVFEESSFSKIPKEDVEHVRFLLDYLVSKALIKSEIVGNKTKYVPQNLTKIKELMGYEKEQTSKITKIDEALVVSIPLSLSNNLSSLMNKYKDVKVVELKNVLKLLIEHASKEILIASPFMEPDGIMYILDEISAAAKRGVSIKIISRDILVKKNYDFSYLDKLKGISKLYTLYEQNKTNPNATISIRDYGTNISQYSGMSTHYEGIHQKMVIVDRKFAYIGSGEIRAASFITNGEAGGLFVGRQAEFWSDFFELFWKEAKEIPKELIESKI